MINTFMAKEFTTSNYYILTFDLTLNNTSFLFGHNATLTSLDGLYLYQDHIELYRDDELLDNYILGSSISGSVDARITRDGNNFSFFIDDNLIYQTDQLSWNTIGTYKGDGEGAYSFSATNFVLSPLVTTDITPSVEDYDGSIYGSDIHLELREDHINLTDYGMLPNGAVGGAKIIVEDVPVPITDLELQLETKYNNTRFERLNNLTGQMQMRIYEDISTSDSLKEYSKVLCSPMPVKNVQTMFTRHSEEGILYYIKDPRQGSSTTPNYLCNAYNLYKGGCQILSEGGVNLFDLDNAYSPVTVGNNLVRAEFHRRSGYIRLQRFDESKGSWVIVNTLKLKDYPQLSLNEFNDDYCELAFGNTTWKFYRGRPFIVCKHPQDDFRVMNLVDRVYCETIENNRSMGFVEEHDSMCSVFNPQLSIQQFKQELHIGQNIRADNFELYALDSQDNIADPTTNATLSVVNYNDENAIKILKSTRDKVALNFPSYSNYVKRVGDTFSLLIGNIISDAEGTIEVIARGFDERGCVPIYDGIQYGIWEQSHDVTIQNCLSLLDGSIAENDTASCEDYLMDLGRQEEYDTNIKVTFTNCPSEVKYLDFLIIFQSPTTSETIIKNLMYYEGDSELTHEVDTSRLYAEKVDVQFSETYYANLYNEDDYYGLSIIRPNQHHIGLTKIYASDETVFVPYMKKASEWDKPNQVFLEYLNSNRQIIDIDWEN